MLPKHLYRSNPEKSSNYDEMKLIEEKQLINMIS